VGLIGGAFLACSTRADAGGPHSLNIVIEPTYTFCISGSASCLPPLRLGFAAQYAPIANRKMNLRIKLSYEYLQSSSDDVIDDVEAPARGFQAASNTLDVRLRLFDDGEYETQEPRAGYVYQYPSASAAGYHAPYLSDSWFFGRGIERGTDSRIHQFRILVKLSQNVYGAGGDPPQTFAQMGPYATFPLDPHGFWRVETGYVVQLQVASPGNLIPYSTRLSGSLTHDFSSAVRAYLRIESRFSPKPEAPASYDPRATTLLLGGRITL
jgi:hypothetical protein